MWWFILGLVAWFLVTLPLAVLFGRRLVRREDHHPVAGDPRVETSCDPSPEQDDDARNGGTD